MSAYEAWKEGIMIYLTETHRSDRWIEVNDGQRRIKVLRPRSRKPNVPATLFHSSRVWPLVRFQTGQVMLCIPIIFEVHNADGRVEAQRVQVSFPAQAIPLSLTLQLKVPLMLAWALSIHKSQGQTLERVRVDLKNIFECGQGTKS